MSFLCRLHDSGHVSLAPRAPKATCHTILGHQRRVHILGNVRHGMGSATIRVLFPPLDEKLMRNRIVRQDNRLFPKNTEQDNRPILLGPAIEEGDDVSVGRSQFRCVSNNGPSWNRQLDNAGLHVGMPLRVETHPSVPGELWRPACASARQQHARHSK